MDAIDPGAGEPSGIRSLADQREAAAERVQRARSEVVAADSAVTTAEWTGQTRAAFGTAVAHTLPDLDLIISGLHAQSAALRNYAGEVQRLKEERATLEARKWTNRMTLGQLDADSLLASHQQYASLTDPPEEQLRRAGLQQRAAQAKAELLSVDSQLQHLADRRRQLDGATAAELGAPVVLGRLVALTAAAALPTAAALFSAIQGLSATDVKVLLAEQPELAQIIAGADPTAVAAWWASLAVPGGGRSALQLALISAIPVVMGSLNGLPAVARAEANVFNARARLAKVETLITEYKDYPTTVGRLRKESGYLHKVVADHPTVKLYLYEPSKSRIIEMIGSPSADTKHVITYVPGTFTNLGSFYGKATQQVVGNIVDSRADAVGFVYKDGMFPGETDGSDALDVARLAEANDEKFALQAGRQLADFGSAIHLDPDLSEASTSAIGHSWGLAAITSSEVAGAHYDNVISLSGAGMPRSWVPSPLTTYADFSYADSLQEVQVLGGDRVWDGNIPRSSPAFEKGPYYVGPVDPVYRLPSGAPFAADQGVLLSNHNLVATDKPENWPLLFDVKRMMFHGR